MNEIPAGFTRGTTFTRYAQAVGEGRAVSRRDMADLFGVSVSTAKYHLERAVSHGLLNKVYDYIGKQPGWLYASPLTMPYLGNGEFQWQPTEQ